jgi:hypothetical protein
LSACSEVKKKFNQLAKYVDNRNNTPYRHQEEFEDTKDVIRICKLKNRQHNGQMKKDKQPSTKHTHKNKDRVTRMFMALKVSLYQKQYR